MNTAIQTEIKKAYLFHDFTDIEIEDLLLICKLEVINQGEMLFSKGVPSDALYMIHYGSVRLQATGPQDQIESTVIVGSSALIGESSIISDRPRLTNAETMERTEVVKIMFSDLSKFFETHVPAALKFYQALCKHLSHSLHTTVAELLRLKEVHQLEKHNLSATL